MVVPPTATAEKPRTVNVDVVAEHGVTSGDPMTTNFSPPALMSVRTKLIRLTGLHGSDTRRPIYDCHDAARPLGDTRTGGGRSGPAGSDDGRVVVALGGTSVALGPGRTAADGSGAREADGGPAGPLPSQAAAKEARSRTKAIATRIRAHLRRLQRGQPVLVRL